MLQTIFDFLKSLPIIRGIVKKEMDKLIVRRCIRLVLDERCICNRQLKMTSPPCPVQDKVRASMVKPEDPKDMQIRKLPSKGVSASALQDKLKYKASSGAVQVRHAVS